LVIGNPSLFLPASTPVVSGHPSALQCALSEKGIQYWDIIPKVFHLDAEAN